MSVEYFDEVDKNDKLTGKLVTIDQAHANKLVHRVSAVYVFDNNGDLYVQVHKASGGLLDHTVGGHVSAGESYEQAAYREMAEEISLKGVTLTQLKVGIYSEEASRIHMFGLYECDAPKEYKFAPTEEVDSIYTKPMQAIVDEMNAHPELYTGGFINTMKMYIEIKNLPYEIMTVI